MTTMNDLANPMDLLKEYVQHMPNAKVTITDELGNEVYFLFSRLDMSYHSSWDTDAFGDPYATYSTRNRNPECVITCYYLGSNLNTEEAKIGRASCRERV
mgnify:CR=1 FL=1